MTRAQLQLIQAEAAADDRRITSEAELQRSVAALLDRLGLLWCHVPNGGLRNKRVAAGLKRQGVKPGVPDVLIFRKILYAVREVGFRQYSGAAIELKHGKNQPSRDQLKWLAELKRHCWYTAVCRTMAEVVAVLEQCGYVGVEG